MKGSLSIFEVAGIQVRVHPTWLIIFALVTWSLAEGYFPVALPGLVTLTYWMLGAISALLLFGSVLVHELSHSLVARARGCGVHSITLFIFGGVSSLEREPQRPIGEFLIAAAGPATSLVLAGLATATSYALDGVTREGAAIFGYLALINLALALFNLLPGFPLDGGRVLRSIVWQVTGSLRRATQIASGAGQLVGYGLILYGGVQVLSGNLLGGVWVAMIGWFLTGAAEASGRDVTLQDQLASLHVQDVMRRNPVTVDPATSLQEVIDGYLLPHNLRAVPVVDHGVFLGVVGLAELKNVPASEWPLVRAGSLLEGRPRVASVGAETALADALRLMGEEELERLPVVADGLLVGVLSLSDMVRYLQVREVVGSGSGRSRDEALQKAA